MSDELISWEDAVAYLRTRPDFQQLITDAYLDEDPVSAVQRYAGSEEWSEIISILSKWGHSGGTVLDIGAGNGIASFAFAQNGFHVSALEPDPGPTVGRGAIQRVIAHAGVNINILEAAGEQIPLTDGSMDVVFARQVLHHAECLGLMCQEIYRVLKPGGLFIALREHVISCADDIGKFLEAHPLHRLYGGEHAYTLEEYVGAIEASGLSILKKFGPFDSVLNFAPMSKESLRRVITAKIGKFIPLPVTRLMLKNDFMYSGLCRIATWKDNTPGRLYSFLAIKPAVNGRGKT